jgi:hypothetical protein
MGEAMQGTPTSSVVIPETMDASFVLNTIATTMTTEAINVRLNYYAHIYEF